MNICVTGGLGHIGSKLIRNLNNSTIDTIHIVDNLMAQRYCSLFDLPEGKKYKFHEIDILSDEIEPIIKDSDVLVHLAAVTDAESTFDKKELVDKINVKGVEHIVNLCSKYNTKLIFPSTTSVYGTQESLVDEMCTDEELKPQSPYAASKRHAEKLIQKMCSDKKLHAVVFRVGTIFGYSIGMRFHTAVNKFLYQAVNGKPISVWKTALHQKRPYCDLDDCIAAVNFFITNNIFDGEIYNIVTKNYTVNDILEAIKAHVPEIKIEFVDSKIMNQLSYNVDNSKSKKIGLAYQGNLKASLKQCIKHLQNINDITIKL